LVDLFEYMMMHGLTKPKKFLYLSETLEGRQKELRCC